MPDLTGDGVNDLDITPSGSSTTIGGAIFTDAVNTGSGTGGYNTFLAISDNDGNERGFNSDDTPPIDNSNEDIDHAKTHTVKLSDLVIITVNGVQYYQFRVDLNESNSDPDGQISLDQFKLYSSTNGGITDTTTLFSQNLIYDMDGGGNVSVLLSDAESSGSGNDDYAVLVPVDQFAGLDPTTTYIYLFVEMGMAGVGWESNATFEEWNLENGVTLSGTKFEDLDGDGVKDDGEGPIEGVTMFIDANQNGVLDAGERTAVTDANGNYSFFGVALDQTLWIDEDLSTLPAGTVQTTGDHEVVVIPDNATPGSTIVIDPIGNFIPFPELSITKDASVPGDCADTVGELITYTVVLDNTGNVALENVVLEDDFEGGGNVTLTVTGDTNMNGTLDVGEVWLSGDTGDDGIMGADETWTYTYVREVTQEMIDSNGGGDGTLDNTATANADGVDGGGTADEVSDDASVDVCQDPALSIDKSASVPGDCADTVGELVTYTVVLDNTGNVTLENVVLEDNFEGGGNVTLTVTGDTNMNGTLDVGEVWLSGDTGDDGIMGVDETWTYSYVRAVTQADIDGYGGGDGLLSNTATANADAVTTGEAADEVSDDASVEVCQDPALSIDKSASVPGDCADTVGELITYTVVLDNTGNVSLENVVLEDNFEGGGNVTLTVTGDTNMNGTLDLGEVWLSGDTGDDGIMGVDETWTYSYVREVTQEIIDSNGGGDGALDNTATANADAVTTGEAADEVSDDASVDVCQDPALSIDKSASVPGDCADTVGELVTYTVVLDNIGNVALDNVVLTDAFEGGSDVTLTVTGDTNMNGIVDAGEVWLSGDTGDDGIMGVDETWTYMYAHEVTQEDIDSNGGGNGTLDNVATANADAVNSDEAADEVSDDASVDVCQDPALSITKDASVPEDCADTVGELVTYTVVLDNIGNVTLENVVLEDNFEGGGNVTLTVTGDANMNGTLDVGEVWLSGDTGDDGIMGVDETWTYTYVHEVTQEDIDSNGYGNGTLDNVATANADAVTTGEAADEVSDDASVDVCQDPAIDIEKYVMTDVNGVFADADDPDGPEASTSSTVDFKVVVTNTGNVTLENITLSDSVIHTVGGIPGAPVAIDYSDPSLNAFIDLNSNATLDAGEEWSNFDTDADGTIDAGDFAELAPGESFTVYYSLDSAVGQHENTATVAADAATTGEDATDSDDANYYVLADEDCVGVRTPGFWQNPNNGGQFWDGIVGNEKNAGQVGFASGELLYGVDSNESGAVGAGDVAGLLIGDYNMNGITDAGEDTIFISLANAQKLINASNKQMGADGIYMLGRDVVAAWLNYLANNEESVGECIGGVDSGDGTNTPQEYLDAAIDWLQQFASDQNSSPANNLVNSYHDGDTQALFQFDAKIHPSSSAWQNPFSPGEDIPVSAAAMHSAIDGYNNTGAIGGVEYCCDADSQIVLSVLQQVALV